MKNNNTKKKDTSKSKTSNSKRRAPESERKSANSTLKRNNVIKESRGIGANSKELRYFSSDRTLATPVSWTIAEEIFSKMATIQDKGDKSLRKDVYNIYVGVNIWCGLFKDITGQSEFLLLNRIRTYGLDTVIKEAYDHCLWITSESTYGIESNFWSQFYNQDYAKVCGQSVHWKLSSNDIFVSTYSGMLTILKYLKRIRIESKDYTFMYADYKARNNRCRDWNQFSFSYYPDDAHPLHYGAADKDTWFITSTQNVRMPSKTLSYEDWTKTYRTCSEKVLDDLADAIGTIFYDYKRDDSLFTLPPGSTYEGAKSYLDKFKIVIRNQAWLRERGVNIPIIPENSPVSPSDCNRYITVPKDYKTGRGVAPEPVSRQVFGYQVGEGMKKCLRKFGVDLRDQSRNQGLCLEALGEKGVILDTIDKSAASDSISARLVRRLFKWCPKLLADLEYCRTNFIEVNGEVIYNHRFATMGNSITCYLQSGIYLAIAMVSYTYQKIFNKESLKKYKFRKHVAVYNDDVVVPHPICDLYCQIAECLGFDINRDKSYTGNIRYRESCGIETVLHRGKMLDVTGKYYPRGTSSNALPELVGLQHAIYAYPTANMIVQNLILDVFPEMTISYPESNYSDIWSSEPIERIGEFYPLRAWILQCTFTVEIDDKVRLKTRKPKSFSQNVSFDITGKSMDYIVYLVQKKAEEFSQQYSKELSDCSVRVSKTWKVIEDETKRGVIHTTLVSSSTGSIPENDKALVEWLMYLLTIGGGIEHINQNDYVTTPKTVINRLDLVHDRKIKIEQRTYFE
jgi:hypothetical protein